MKTFYSNLILFATLLLSSNSFVNAQCGTNTTLGTSCTRSAVFDAQYNADLGCGTYRTITNYSPGTYFRMPVLSGGCYTVQTCGAGIDTQIGAFQGTATTGPFAYNDDSGPACAGTAASIIMTPNFTDYARIDVRQFNCSPGGTASITVRIRQNNNLNFTSSSASMCSGQTRTLTATPTAVTGGLAGSGNGGSFSGTGVSGTTFTAPTPAGASQVYTITYTFGFCTTTQNITVFRNPSTANAGANQNLACDATATTLAGNTPAFGTGTWTLIGGTGTVTTPGSATSGVTGLSPGSSSTFRWTITNGPCSASTDDVIISSSADGTAPVPDVATLPDITTQCVVSTLTAPTATDNCAGSVTGTTATSTPITTQGTTVVTWTYDDGNGNSSSQNQNVIIDDVTAPVPDVAFLTDILAQCSVTTLTAPTATDNCGGTLTVTNNATLPITTQGTTVVTWTYDDGNGNTSTQNQNVILDDVTAPVPDVATLADVTAPCSVTSLTAPAATDNCGGTVTVTNDATLPITTQGTTVVTWTYTDVNGNSSTQTQNVVIDDIVAPVPNAGTLSDVTVECVVTSLTAPTATDNCSGSVTATTATIFPITAQGTTAVTWTYDDGNGNTSSQTQNVIIDDVTAPVPDVATLADVTAECDVTSLTAPTATDNCGGTVTVTNDATLPITTQGTTVVTWTYDDGNGNTTTQTQNVVIDDVTAPTPDVATLADVTAECSVSSLTAPTATDNCGGTVTVTNDAVLPISTQGTTVVTWTYTDVNGNSSTQTQNVVVDDVTAPVPDVATLADVTAPCSVTSLTAPTATDNCGGTVTVTNDATLPITTQGTTVVTWTYTDVNGNSSTQTQNVVIDDNLAPVPNAGTLADVTVECVVTSLTAPTATDNCSGSVTATTATTFPITAQGTTVVTWTYDDGNGNTSSQTQNVIIDDVTAPVPDVATLADVTAECDVTSLTAPTATDNCGGTVTVTNDATLPITTQGTTVITWTYDDGNGNTTTQTQNVVIDDVTAPTPDVATLADVTAECSVTSLTAPTATDNCGGTVTVTNDAVLPITTQGTTVVTWTYTDVNGNSSTQTQNVVVDDVTAPVPDVATLADVTAECSVSSLTAPTATDNCGGTVTVTNDATLPITTQGTTVVTWTYDDGNGNTSTQTQNVVIDDVTAPVPDVATLADLTAECDVTSLIAPTATDNCGGTVTVTNDATLPITTQGTTVVTWTYDDGNGNTTTQTQNVVIDDVTAPTPDVATLADVTAECDVTSLSAPTATDNCGGTVTVTNDATLPITTQGTTVVTWTYTDVNGNSSTQTQNVVIDDLTAPTPDVATLADVTAECDVTSLTTPTATDNCGGTVTVTNDATLPISTQGTTVVTWTYTDVNGNSSTQTQNVVIDDVTAPTPDVATLADVTAECDVTSLTAPTATDNCGGTVTVTNDATLPITTQGTTVVTWTYDDGNGNTSTQTQNVVIDDVTAPVPDVATLADVTAECDVTSLTAPTATDNCGGTVTVTNDATLPITTQGTVLVTWTYTDVNGNSSTQTQNVVVDDITAPTPDSTTLNDVSEQCDVTSLTAPTATDNCGGTVTVTNDATFPITTQGTTVVTWTYTDVNGNSSTQAQNIVILDVEGPVADAALPDLTGLCSIDAPSAPTATDNCAGTVTGTTTTTFPITAIGTTVVTWEYSDGNGNVTLQTQDFIISGVDVSTDLSADGATITALNTSGTYQWIDCSDNSIIAGETGQSFTPTANGDYAVIVTQDPCVDTSACVTVSTVGIETISITKLTVYPNPSIDGYFTVSYDGTIESIQVLDMLGREITLPANLTTGEVDGSTLAHGRYIIRVKTESGYALSEIVIAQ
ncbi:MAG: T9SS type A sorting domain-containing protein [Crocinitomicaceae bacterium]|nr:T9SS type A sorting domain-containing protein [Crocinitomicaceae bacterium]